MNNSSVTDFHKLHFDSIQALRGITALFIVLEHVRFLNCGAFGVDIFFCISGFMIMFSTHNDTNYFFRKRLIRILPLYYLMTVGTYFALLLFPDMFAQTKANPVFLLKSLLFIPFDIGDGIIQPLVRIGWTVNCEIFFYLLFFISFKISHKYRGLLCSLLLAAFVIAANLLPAVSPILSFYGNPVMLDFILGILCYYLTRGLYALHTAGKLPGFSSGAGVVLCFSEFLGLIISKPHINILGFNRPIIWGIPAFLMVLSVFVAGLSGKKMPAALVQLGNISFSLYLLHYYPVMLLDRKLFDFSVFSPMALLGTAIAIALSVTLAFISYFLIERGLSGCLRKKFLP